eukprot:scpid32232/ scgid31813/ 
MSTLQLSDRSLLSTKDCIVDANLRLIWISEAVYLLRPSRVPSDPSNSFIALALRRFFVSLEQTESRMSNNTFIRKTCKIGDIQAVRSKIFIEGLHIAVCPGIYPWILQQAEVHISQITNLRYMVMGDSFIWRNASKQWSIAWAAHVVIDVNIGATVADVYQDYGLCSSKALSTESEEFSYRPKNPVLPCSIQVEKPLRFICDSPRQATSAYNTSTECNAYGMYSAASCSGTPVHSTNHSIICTGSNFTALIIKRFGEFETLAKGKPTWILFRHSSTECIKQRGATWLYSRKQCNGTAISEALKHIRQGREAKDEALIALRDQLMRHRHSLTNTFIGQDSWSLPWVHAAGQDWKSGEWRVGPKRRWHTNYSDYLGSLVLYPAAGEMISIHLEFWTHMTVS